MSITPPFHPAAAFTKHQKMSAEKQDKEYGIILDDTKLRLELICNMMDESKIMNEFEETLTSPPAIVSLRENVEDIDVKVRNEIIRINNMKILKKKND